MKRFKYIGGHDGVDLAGNGTVKHGATVDVEETSVSESLEQQPDVWQHIPDPKRSAAAKKAAEKHSNPSPAASAPGKNKEA